jgi:hypothetical protein
MLKKITREKLIQDIRQLNDILEDAHPDPYINGGGKIAYHRRLQEVIANIPEDGMTAVDFFYHINPFVAKIEDAHTGLIQSKLSRDEENPGGLPLYFSPVEDFLFVSAVTSKDQLRFIGAKLISVEGVPLIDLISRMKNHHGFDNLSNLLGNLGRFGMLFFKDNLQKLIPEWSNATEITVELKLSNGKKETIKFKPAKNVVNPLLTNESTITLPDSDKNLNYHFIDDKKNIAFLKIADMITFREAHELFLEIGLTEFHELLKKLYVKYKDENIPEKLEDVIKGLPSATELFTSLFREMKEAKTEFLLVDVSKCQGGQDYIILFLLYFLVGFKKGVELIQTRSNVLKLSKLLDEKTKDGLDLESVSYYDKVPLIINDYLFSSDKSFSQCMDDSGEIESYAQSMKQMPSFYKEFTKREFESYYIPNNILVLVSDITHSSGFDLMLNLNRIGAVNVGVASGQSGNHFGNIRQFELNNSKIKGKVATRFFIAFPDKPMKHLTHEPDFKITYEKLMEYNFDVNSILLYALDLIKEKKI